MTALTMLQSHDSSRQAGSRSRHVARWSAPTGALGGGACPIATIGLAGMDWRALVGRECPRDGRDASGFMARSDERDAGLPGYRRSRQRDGAETEGGGRTP